MQDVNFFVKPIFCVQCHVFKKTLITSSYSLSQEPLSHGCLKVWRLDGGCMCSSFNINAKIQFASHYRPFHSVTFVLRFTGMQSLLKLLRRILAFNLQDGPVLVKRGYQENM